MTDKLEYIHQYKTPMGIMTGISEGTAITGLSFEMPEKLSLLGKQTEQKAELPVFQELDIWIGTYFAGEDPGVRLPIKPEGTPFQQSVWQIVAEVPYGTLITYGEIARRLARQRGIPRMSAQAVGGAMARNPISLLIPCHRVIAADGSLGGYGGCLERKRELLRCEGIIRIT